MEIIVYTLPVCPRCDMMKAALCGLGLEFSVRDIENEDNYAELLIGGCTYVEAPIVMIDGTFYDMEGALQKLGVQGGCGCIDGNCGIDE